MIIIKYVSFPPDNYLAERGRLETLEGCKMKMLRLTVFIILLVIVAGCGLVQSLEDGDSNETKNTLYNNGTRLGGFMSSLHGKEEMILPDVSQFDERDIENEYSDVATEICKDIDQIPYRINNQYEVTAIYESEFYSTCAVEWRVRYPQLASDCIDNTVALDEVNYMLKYLAYKFIGGNDFPDINLRSFILEPMYKEKSTGVFRWFGETKYEILFCDVEYISALYRGFRGVYNAWSGIALATLNIRTGELLTLDMLFDAEQIESLIREGNYELVEGNYLPGGIDIDSMETHNDIANNFRDSPGAVSIENAQPGEYDLYNPYDSMNFCIDGEYIYIWVYYCDSLHGYVLIRMLIADLAELEK